MKILVLAFALVTLAGCYRDTTVRDDRGQTPGEAAGRAAYEIKQKTEKGAKELSKELKSFGKDAKEGYQEQRERDLARKKAREEEK